MLRQHQELKQQHPGPTFLSPGDFYELFLKRQDRTRELQITLTAP